MLLIEIVFHKASVKWSALNRMYIQNPLSADVEKGTIGLYIIGELKRYAKYMRSQKEDWLSRSIGELELRDIAIER
jgi:hypothetical protein